MSLGNLYTSVAIAVFVYFCLFYLAALVKKDNSVIDIAWGGGFIVVVVVSLALLPEITERHRLVSALVVLWGFRLAGHILVRSLGKGEDFRYRNMREGWKGNESLNSFVRIFMLQAVILTVLAYPLVHIFAVEQAGLTLWDVIGLSIWVIGFLFEAIGDYQLYRFKKNPTNKGSIITSGLWRYTRHPNYFGEATMWWGIGILALSTQGGWIALGSPLLLTFLLLKVSGVPLLEQRYMQREDYREYARRTSRFIPWFPRR